MSREYWVYENWRVNKAVLHYGECSYCKHGKGHQGTTNETNGKWHGFYTAFDLAQAKAEQTERKVWPCKHCGPH